MESIIIPQTQEPTGTLANHSTNKILVFNLLYSGSTFFYERTKIHYGYYDNKIYMNNADNILFIVHMKILIIGNNLIF